MSPGLSINWGPAVQPQHQKRQPDGGGGRISDPLSEYPGADPEAESELTSSLSQPTGKLRISLPVIGYRLLLPALTAFSRLYPQVELDLDFSDRLVNLIDEGVDVAIRSGELADSRLIARKLGGFRFVLCASPTYLAEYGVPGSPAELAAHKCIFSASRDGADPALGTARYATDGRFQGRCRDDGQ